MARSLEEIENELTRVRGELNTLGDIMETAKRRFHEKAAQKAVLDVERFRITGTVMCVFCGKDSLPGECPCLEQ